MARLLSIFSLMTHKVIEHNEYSKSDFSIPLLGSQTVNGAIRISMHTPNHFVPSLHEHIIYYTFIHHYIGGLFY